jgi:acyl-[acyl-carrier-protein]-phospholipid O-acyltransferase/long-chain-fatty-acid--[acyl-carrier-protein] ligase
MKEEVIVMQQRTKWLPLFFTNFVGVLNDNFLKHLICFVSILWLAEEHKSLIVMAASGLMVLPYILFSPLAGKFSKERSKAKIIQTTQLLEIPIMGLAAAGFIFENLIVVLISMFLMGLQSCMYSPAKYGIIRDIGGKTGISFGTGTMEMLTFVAVLIGTFVAGLVSDIHLNPNIGKWQVAAMVVGLLLFAVSGWLSSLKIRPQESQPDEAEDSSLNPLVFARDSYRWSKQIKGLNYAILGLATFWLIGALLQMNIIIYGPEVLGLSNTRTSLIMALVAVGIGTGCYLAGVVSSHRVKTSLIPVGGIGMFTCVTIIVLLQPGALVFTALIVGTAFFAGFFKIPLNAFMQDRVEGRKLGHILAYNNLTVFFFILLSSGLFGLIETFFGPRLVFAFTGLVILFISWLMWKKIPGASWFKK